MRISVAVVGSDVQVSQDFILLEVFPDMSLEGVKGFIEDEIQIAPSAQHFIINNQPVADTNKTLTDLGIGEGDIISLVVRTAAQQPPRRTQNAAQQSQSSASGSTMPDAETLRLQFLNNASLLADIRQRDPEMAHAINDPDTFRRAYESRMQQNADAQREKAEQMALLDADPFNVEAQAKIEEIIRQQRVTENFQKALEENPESFGRVHILYIDVTVNNNPIKAFVDSGAQTTIMSPEAAEKCGIMRLIDRRYGGIARGVGTAVILGRVHSADIQIGQYNLASSFTVMEGKGVDLLLGLDMLKRHQMCIDLKDNCLRIQNDAIQFLSESEIPKGLDEAMDEEPTVKGPGNTEIGATTGTVKPAPAGPSSSSASAPSTSSASGPSGIRIHPRGSAGNVLTQGSGTQQQSQPQPQQRQQPPAQRPAQRTSSTGISEESITMIIERSGVSREQAIQALQLAGGNVDGALSYLLFSQ